VTVIEITTSVVHRMKQMILHVRAGNNLTFNSGYLQQALQCLYSTLLSTFTIKQWCPLIQLLIKSGTEDSTFRKRYIAPKKTTIPLHRKYVTYNEGVLTTGHDPTSSVLHITHQSEGQSGISLL
jgi:hypothetical protein